MRFHARSVCGEDTNMPYQYIATVVGSIATVATGTLLAWPTPSLPQLLDPKSPIKITTSDGAWLAVMPCLSTIIGCLLAASFVDKIGRKLSMLIVSPLYVVSWILIIAAKSKHALYASRVLSGISDGIAYTAFPMYVGEIADPKVRGLLCSTISITAVLGYMLISIVGSIFNIRDTALISVTLPILHFILFYFMPESPYYLLMKGKTEKAKRNLIKLRGYSDIDDQLERLSSGIKEDQENRGNIWDLFTVESNRKGVYIIGGLRGLQQLCGQMAITFYATIIFRESGSYLSSASCTGIFFAIQLICTVICSFLVDRVGRRPLLIISCVGSGISLAVEGAYFYFKDNTDFNLKDYSWIPVVALLMFDILFNLGFGTIPVMMLGELFSTSVKAFALCLAEIYVSIVVVIATKFFQIMNDSAGMSIPFFVFSAFSFVALLFVIFIVPETKGKTLEEIQDYFKGIRNSQSMTS